MASGAYARGLEQFAAGGIDWDADLIKVMSMKTGYSLNKETHEYADDVSASRYVGTTDKTGTKRQKIPLCSSRFKHFFGINT